MSNEENVNVVENWYTSDLHFNHKNIIEYCNRPTTFAEQNEWLITRLNSFIGVNDTVHHVGDFMFGSTKKPKEREVLKERIKEVLKQLNGNWRFIIGNHDREEILKQACEELGKHEVLGDYHVEVFNGRKFVMCHFPFRSWQDSRHGSINVHGHTHGGLLGKEYPNQIDVGLDATGDFRPLTAQEIITIVNERNPDGKKVDHHEGQKSAGN